MEETLKQAAETVTVCVPCLAPILMYYGAALVTGNLPKILKSYTRGALPGMPIVKVSTTEYVFDEDRAREVGEQSSAPAIRLFTNPLSGQALVYCPSAEQSWVWVTTNNLNN